MMKDYQIQGASDMVKALSECYAEGKKFKKTKSMTASQKIPVQKHQQQVPMEETKKTIKKKPKEEKTIEKVIRIKEPKIVKSSMKKVKNEVGPASFKYEI